MAMAIKDILDSINKNVDSRLSSPFFGAFVISWTLCNWDKLAVLFFGEKSVDSRVLTFKEALKWVSWGHENTWHILWLPLFFSCLYLFVSPYLHILIQQIQSHSNGWRYRLTVNQDVTKEGDRGLLVKAKAKADSQDKIAEDEIRAEIENSLANTKKLQEEAEAANARKSMIYEKYLESKEKNRELKLKVDKEEAEALSVITTQKKKEMELEKAQMPFQKKKSEHENYLATLRFPLSFQYMNTLSDSLSHDDWRCSLSNLSEIIATVFGYQSFEMLINDESFSASNINKIKYLSYDSETLFNCLNNVIEMENEEYFDADWLFEHIQMTLDQYSLQLQDIDSIVENAIEELWDGSLLYYLTNTDAVSSEMATTNVDCFDELENLEKGDHRWVNGDGLYISYSCTISGSNDPDKMFSGDTISVELEVKHPIVVGEAGLGSYEIYNVNAQLVDYWDESAGEISDVEPAK